MNPLSNTITDMKLAPMREVSKTLQIRWYRCPVDKKVLRGLMTPDDTRGLFMALGHLGLWAATGGIAFYLFVQQMWVGFAGCSSMGRSGPSSPHHIMSCAIAPCSRPNG